jgi:hypothetical protein
MKHSKNYWTYDKCKEEALKYKTKTEYQKNSKGAYNSSRNNGWFEDICSHMISNVINKPYGYWTYERCKDEALKYKTRMEFKINSAGAYKSLMKNKWFSNLCVHMLVSKKLIHNYWTYERCKDEALKYKTKKDYKKNSIRSYYAATRKHWIDNICSHMPNRYYKFSKGECLTEALKYRTKTEFRTKSVSIFGCSVKNNWIDEICSHMNPVGNKYNRCIYAAEFSDNHVYVGLTYNIDKRIKDHLKRRKSAIYKHIIKTGIQPEFKKITDYLDVNLASKIEGNKLNEYIKNGWVSLNKNKCGAIGGYNLNEI